MGVGVVFWVERGDLEIPEHDLQIFKFLAEAKPYTMSFAVCTLPITTLPLVMIAVREIVKSNCKCM